MNCELQIACCESVTEVRPCNRHRLTADELEGFREPRKREKVNLNAGLELLKRYL